MGEHVTRRQADTAKSWRPDSARRRASAERREFPAWRQFREIAGRPAWRTGLLIAVMAIGALGLVFAWATASPAGSSPDEDFHLVSSWCPQPLDRHCDTRLNDHGRREVLVPQTVAQAPLCYRFDARNSAACTLELSDDLVWSHRVDHGNYPGGFYPVMHLLTGDNVFRSVVAMRLVNGILFFGLMAALALCLDGKGRRLLTYALLATSVPFVLSLLPAANPSSWAITGVVTAFVGGYAAFQAASRAKRWTAVGLALFGALLAVVSRADSAAFTGIVGLVLVIMHFDKVRKHPWILWALGAIMAAGLLVVVTSDQAAVLLTGWTSGWRAEEYGADALLWNNLTQFPYLLLGFALAPLNWLDTPMPSGVWVPVIALAGALAFRGLGHNNWRKTLSLAGLLALMVVIPLYVLHLSGEVVGHQVQARYFLPLVPVIMWLLLWNPRTGGTFRLSRVHTVLVYVGLVGAQAIALHTQIRRFTTGLQGGFTGLGPGVVTFLTPFDLGRDVQWWHSGPSPMATWVIGSLGFALLALALFAVSARSASASVVTAGAVDAKAVTARAVGEEPVHDNGMDPVAL